MITNSKGVEAPTGEERVYKGMKLITGGVHSDGSTEPAMISDYLKNVSHDILSSTCDVYMRINKSMDRLLRIYSKQLDGNDVCARYPSLICIIKEQEETINGLRRELQYIISSVLSGGCLNCVLKFVKSGKV